jgi:hypothetical protein
MNQTTPLKNSTKLGNPWFDEFIGELRSHEIQLETNTAPQGMVELYQTLFAGDAFSIIQLTRESSTIFYVKHIVIEFLKGISENKADILSLSLNYSDSNVRMWCVIRDNDVENENILFRNEAKINAKYYQYGFHLSLTIVEESDKIPVPVNFENFFKRGNISGTPPTGKA